MKKDKQICLVCNCEGTMPIDADKLSSASGIEIKKLHSHLCRTQLDAFENALSKDQPLLVACTQEAPLFQEIAEENSNQNELTFVNIREMAGWSKEAQNASPKIAALLANSNYEAKPARLKAINSDGMCLVYGSGQAAYDAAKLLSDKLSVTLLLSTDEEIVLPSMNEVPVYRGDIKQVEGSFGEFSLSVDNYAPLMPSSKNELAFVMARNDAKTQCSLILDLSGNAPLFSGHTHRDGYKRVDVGDPAGILSAVIALSDMVGEFEKPIYVDYNQDICAHSRSQKQGCNKCWDVCPAGAIHDAGDNVEIDNGICGGCGSCHSVCPTGAISYQYPDRTDIIGRAQNLATAYSDAGGKNPVFLIHDEQAGVEMISALARYGKGLPANVIPLSFHSPTTLGHVEILAILASGVSHILFFTDPAKFDELGGLKAEAKLSNAILEQLGLQDETRIHVISENDPDVVEKAIWNLPKESALTGASFTPVGTKRDMARLAYSALHQQSKSKPDVIPLPDASPYGKLDINSEACTLCMACTSACPTAAISDTPGEPKLRFTQSACVQCSLCVNTCPESALSLVPQLDFTPSAMQPVTLYEEEPFNCISCNTPFATKSTIERITAQLAGKHTMFADEEKSKLIKMCDKCRIETQANGAGDPFSSSARPRPRTTEDYINAEKGNLSADDFLIDD